MTRNGPMWDPGIWEDIREAMRRVAERGAVGRQFLPRVVVEADMTTITVDRFDGDRVVQNQTIPILEIYAQFRLTAQQVEREDTYREGRAAAVALAHDLARAEDCVLLGIEDGAAWPKSVKRREVGKFTGLLSKLHNPKKVPSGRFGEDLVTGVEEALRQLQDRAHYGPYGLLLTPRAYADAKSPIPGSLVVPIDLVARDVEWILRSRLLEYNGEAVGAGVVVSVGGNSLDLVVSNNDYAISFVHVDQGGLYVFRVSHRLALRIKREDTVEPVVPMKLQ